MPSERPPIPVAVAQPRCVPHDVAENAVIHAAVVRSADARVVVFPELSLTGYHLDAPTVEVGDERLAPIVGACAETGSVALVGAPVEGDAGDVHIGMLAVDATGARVAYRKMWLGGDEPSRFRPGSAPGVLEVDGWRLGLAICRDSRQPQHAADTAALGIDAYVAGMVESGADASAPEERALRIAREHDVWVAIASHAGPTGGGFDETAGRSGIWAPGGRRVDQAGPEVGAVVRAAMVDAVDVTSGDPNGR